MSFKGHSPAKAAALPLAALLLLCLLWSLGSLRADLLPRFAPPAGAQVGFALQALPLALVAIVAATAAILCRTPQPRPGNLSTCLGIGLSLFVAPAMLIHLAGNRVSALTRVALFSLVPVFAVVFEPYLGDKSAAPSRTGLMAALIAVIGTLFLFPIDLPQSGAAVAAFCAVVVATACIAAANCWAVRVAVELPKGELFLFATIASLSAVVGCSLMSALTERAAWNQIVLGREMAWSALVEFPALLILFWLMRRMSATCMATRYLVAPLITALLGLIFLRPALGVRDCLGLSLIAIGSGWLLLARQEDDGTDAAILKLY